MMRLTGRSDCYTPLPGPQPVLMPAVPADVHVVVQGGFSDVVQATGHISEFGGKPVVSFGATDVALSDKVSPGPNNHMYCVRRLCRKVVS